MRGDFNRLALAALAAGLLLATGPARGQDAPRLDLFQVGAYGDDARAVTCVKGPAGASFHLVVWAWVPDELGLAYITLRFDFPDNLDLSARPVFDDRMTSVIVSDYPDGTVEWNMLFTGCESGWVRVFTQEFVLLDEQPSRIGIQAAHSMIRDCAFALNDVEVLNELTVNDPRCASVPSERVGWGGLKSRYR